MRGDSDPPPPPPPQPLEMAESGRDPAAAEALRLLAMAEARLASASSLKSALKYAKRAARLRPGVGGAAALVAALRVLRADPSDHYGVLRLPPLSSAAAIRRRYKTLALDLHPDRSPFPSSSSSSAVAVAEEAFKRVAESFRVLSDRSLKRRLDLRLRRGRRSPPPEEEEERAATFWTACAACRLLHEFHRRYVGYRLVCPSCRKSFLAVEVPNPNNDDDDDDEAEDPEQEEGEEEAEENGDDNADDNKSRVRASSRDRARARRVTKSRSNSRPRVSRFPPLARQKRRIEPRLSNSPLAGSKKPRTNPEKTLAEMQMELSREKKRKERKGNVKPLLQPKEEEENDSSLMVVEDSDFYDFDKDRSEKSFRKGQIWAIYDDDDGMPRHYGLIEEVVSSDPFRIRMSWLDIENHGDEHLLLLEKSGFHISCGRFKIGRKVEIRSVNLFSHLIDCERAARELFRVYPKKGSVWALYGDWNFGGEERRRHYDIVVLLTSYSDMYGVSMAYLEKVGGYKSVFKRREVGALAIRCIEKEDVRVFSHQIPARKLSGTEGLDLPRDCWELDPASLTAEMLSVTWSR
ncbi:uncharacterized protein LOC109727355 [Ananas comosus]|uniref:Uncharacterized protein LOC109727355 n=1 Tax=Ananas comosus TaxID=4615 RepID=A0A199UUR4_ANACO|nr:uncharacterized protein LOC109727355 [Ananas comosus]OAY68528.1 hypothetical protein ACMD2_04416 [Ananas comosus]